MSIEERLQTLGIELPETRPAGANYLPSLRIGDIVYISGQLPKWNGEYKFIGKVGREFDESQGQQAARLCALNLVAVLREALGGNLDLVRQCIRVGGYVNCTPDFTAHSQVVNGASDLLFEVLGAAGRHTRIAVGMAALPYDCAVEVEAQFHVR
ncbi:MAG TPA: RidA family protein [Thermoanaerobaculia bacterium]|jgi:enamine deaminase RidA (YjgF/YER057c/UK114 family)|nr:RidA family protein [Thermoanaerobaculia bacterium]